MTWRSRATVRRDGSVRVQRHADRTGRRARGALSPGLLASAATVARLVQAQGVAPDSAVQLALTQQLKVLGEPGFAPQRLCADFDLAHLNVAGGVSPQALMGRLAGMRQGNLLFSGPPGTGKTELAHQIARHLGRELVVRTAANLHSKWYGESEQRVAAMFVSCDAQGELLLIDEADAILASREPRWWASSCATWKPMSAS